MTDSERHLVQIEERLGNTLLELEKVKGKYTALNAAYIALLEQLFGNEVEVEVEEGGRHIFYSSEDIH